MTRVRQVVANIIICFMILFPAVFAGAEQASTPSLIFSEVKVRNDSAGYDEFIEIYNNSASSLSLNNYYIEYFNTHLPLADQQPIGKAVISSGLLTTNSYFVLAKNPTQIVDSAQSPFSSLADSGGTLRMTDLNANIIDEISWTSTTSQAIAPIVLVPASSTTKSLTRGTDINGVPIAENPSWSLANPSPHSVVLVEPEPDPQPDPDPGPTPDPLPEEPAPDPVPPQTDEPAPNQIANLLPLQISELLPNPASPVTDDEGEFVELYNPNLEPIDLAGYKLQTGNNYTYSFVFTTQSIAANSYQAFYAPETNAVLANSSGRARLLDASGQIVSETNPYEDADDDTAWAMISGLWQWTLTPTPNAANVLTLPTPVAASLKSSAKKTAAKKPAAAKSSSAKAKTASSKSTKAKTAGATTGTLDEDDQSPAPLHPSILAGVGGAALLYGLYEYRQDISNSLYKFKRYREIRRAGRSGA